MLKCTSFNAALKLAFPWTIGSEKELRLLQKNNIGHSMNYYSLAYMPLIATMVPMSLCRFLDAIIGAMNKENSLEDNKLTSTSLGLTNSFSCVCSEG